MDLKDGITTMADFFENLGLDWLVKTEDDIVRLFSLVAQEGAPLVGYDNTIYMNYHFGDAQLIAREIISDADEKIEVVGMDTHSRGSCVWNTRLSEMNVTPKDADAAQRYCVLKRAEDGSGMAVAHIVNADVLPSFLEDDFVRLQMVGFGVDFHYFADEDEYSESCPEGHDGKKWLLSDGTIIPTGLMFNHDPDRDEAEKNCDLDAHVLLRGTVKKLLWGVLDFNGDKENGYIRCYVDTQYGELELIHTLEQTDESDRSKIKIGAIISGIFVLSGDAGIYEYQKGVVFDEEHNLRLLRYCFVRGNAKRTRHAFTEDAIYKSASSGKEFNGRDQIIEYLQYVHDANSAEDLKYRAHMAVITSIDDDGEKPPEYPIGKRCVVLAKEDNKNYESIAFIDTDENGKTIKLSLSVDSIYHFKIDDIPKSYGVFEDVKLPESVMEPIINRARFHGFIDDAVEDAEVTDNLSEYQSYKFNAEQMLEAMNTDVSSDNGSALPCIFGYLFAKETERFVNEARFFGKAGLLISYDPSEALDGKLRSRLSPDEHLVLTEAMKRASQFYKDYKYFVEYREKTKSETTDDLLRALIVVQRIGYLYGGKFLEIITAKEQDNQL
jgi:hypothetical protein